MNIYPVASRDRACGVGRGDGKAIYLTGDEFRLLQGICASYENFVPGSTSTENWSVAREIRNYGKEELPVGVHTEILLKLEELRQARMEYERINKQVTAAMLSGAELPKECAQEVFQALTRLQTLRNALELRVPA
jgi:hypothetical protein